MYISIQISCKKKKWKPASKKEKGGDKPYSTFSLGEALINVIFYVFSFGSPMPTLQAKGALDKVDCRTGRSGNTLEVGRSRCNGGIDKRLREEGFFIFAVLPLTILRRDRSRA
jgi:hypothetical protein